MRFHRNEICDFIQNTQLGKQKNMFLSQVSKKKKNEQNELKLTANCQ